MRVWMKMALPLVFMLPNSSCFPFPGKEKSSPGWSSTNSTTPINTGAQSAIFPQKSEIIIIIIIITDLSEKKKRKEKCDFRGRVKSKE